MNVKKLFSLMLALLLCLSGLALAEDEDLQSQLDAANARIEELEAQLDVVMPVYESQVVATYGENGVILKEDAQKEYDAAVQMYSQYGLSVDAYAPMIKQSILESLVQSAVLDEKAAELGLSDLSEETRSGLEAQAQESFNSYVDAYKGYFATDASGNEVSDEEATQSTIAYLEQNGLTMDAMVESITQNYISEQLHDTVTADVEVTDEDVQATYQAMIEDNKESFAENDQAYNAARTQGEAIAWNPEGYRAVKHVLIKFDDDQAAQYTELQGAVDDLQDELDALMNPEDAEEEAGDEAENEAEDEAEDDEALEVEVEAEEAEEAEVEEEVEVEAEEETEVETEEVAEEDEAAENEEEAEDVEAPEEPRTIEEVQTELGVAGAELEALYSDLLPTAQEVIDAFNAGTDIDTLIATYGGDPGMTNEPTMTDGYAVAEGSTYWERAFTDGAMSIGEVGQISEPVYGSNGIHIIYYMADIPAGEVPFEDIEDAVREKAQSDKIDETYEAQVNAWVEEAAPTYYVDRF